MDAKLKNETSIRQYLLGELSDEERQQWELDLMTGTSTLEEIQIAEEELIDDYLRQALPAREREQFESFFLAAPERRQKLEFARSLKRYVASHPPVKGPPWIFSILEPFFFWRWQKPELAWSTAAAFLALILLGGSWSVYTLRQSLSPKEAENLRSQMDRLQSRNAELQGTVQGNQGQLDQLAREMARLKEAGPKGLPPAGGSASGLLSFALMPGLVRDMEGPRKLVISPGTKLIKFQLHLGADEYPRYRAVLQTMEEEEIWMQTWPRSGPTGEVIGGQLILPAALFTRGDYLLRLSGINGSGNWEEIGKFYFRVVVK